MYRNVEILNYCTPFQTDMGCKLEIQMQSRPALYAVFMEQTRSPPAAAIMLAGLHLNVMHAIIIGRQVPSITFNKREPKA